MTPHRPLVPSADATAFIPKHAGARVDRLDAAIRSLMQEARRLERLGLRHALLECRRQLRYWEFLKALFALETPVRPSRGTR
jgi:hypothetical protein